MTPDCDESIRCTLSTCSCVCFKPGNDQLRSCDRCGHSWVMHALDKLRAHPLPGCCPVEVVLPGLVFDLSSLVLYGAQAIPVRLKILLDRLFSVLTTEQVGHILEVLGWSLGDYIRGYMLQVHVHHYEYPNGKVLENWLMVNADEELLVLKQFLRFGETRPIVELMKVQRLTPNAEPTENSKITAFIERNSHVLDRVRSPSTWESLHGDAHPFRKRNPVKKLNNPVCHFEKIPGGLSLLLPFHFATSTFSCLANKDFAPLSELMQYQRDAKQLKTEEPAGEEKAMHQSEDANIKEDPDKPSHSNLREITFNLDERTKQTSTSALTLVSSPPVFSKSTSPFQVSLPTSMRTSQKLEASVSPSLSTLPSFSSFLCPLPKSSFSPSLHPLPTSLCSVSSLSGAGGRKGRVCCGVCGKSFYDKGTLKIHYNAVHLKIKHRCTVAGCTMVFSSLRSRNRHSANPNPRLHVGTSRDMHTQKLASQQGEVHRGASSQDDRTHIWRNIEADRCWQQELAEQATSCLTQPNGNWKNTPTSTSKPLPDTHSLLPIQRSSTLDSQPPMIPSPIDDPHESLTNHTPLSVCNFPPAFVPSKRCPADIDTSLLILKKKPRKSSMPVKIHREAFEGRRIKQEKC